MSIIIQKTEKVIRKRPTKLNRKRNKQLRKSEAFSLKYPNGRCVDKKLVLKHQRRFYWYE